MNYKSRKILEYKKLILLDLKWETVKWINKANKILGKKLFIPRIYLMNKIDEMDLAGQVKMFSRNRCNIRYSANSYMVDRNRFLKIVVPHEVAHYFTVHCYGLKTPAHGKKFKTICKKIGVKFFL